MYILTILLCPVRYILMRHIPCPIRYGIIGHIMKLMAGHRFFYSVKYRL